MGHLGHFQLLAMTNKAPMNMVEYVPLFHSGASFGYIPKSTIAVSSGQEIFPVFWGNSRLIYIVVVAVCSPTSNPKLSCSGKQTIYLLYLKLPDDTFIFWFSVIFVMVGVLVRFSRVTEHMDSLYIVREIVMIVYILLSNFPTLVICEWKVQGSSIYSVPQS